jgi:hypothetical protein
MGSKDDRGQLTRRSFGALTAGSAATWLAAPTIAQVNTPAIASTEVTRLATYRPGLVMVEPAMTKDPNLRAVAEDVLAQLKYSFAAVAADDRGISHASHSKRNTG